MKRSVSDYQDWGHINYRRLKEREANPPRPEVLAKLERERAESGRRAKITRLRKSVA